MIGRPFPGRVVFDHLPKTAGTAINNWLRSSLGSCCVTESFLGHHRQSIGRYGGSYSVISGHLAFCGEGLDPRYQYVTCLREPIDRALSWLRFVLGNYEEKDLGEIWRFAQRFVASDGDEVTESSFLNNIRNMYVDHFAAIEMSPVTKDSERVSVALSAIEKYDIWGLYEELPTFLADFSALLGLPAPGDLARVNVTRSDQNANSISLKLRRRLEEINALDLEFYYLLKGRYQAARLRWQRPAVAVPQWVPQERRGDRIFEAARFVLLSVSMEGKEPIFAGNALSFILEFSLTTPVGDLEIGIHIYDEDGRWAFGTNTTLLGHPLRDLSAGTYREHWAVAAYLPEGRYTAGFAFAERVDNGVREIAWYDSIVSFRVLRPTADKSVGYSCLPVGVVCRRVSDRIVQLVSDAKGELRCNAPLRDLAPGEVLSLPVVLANDSTLDWVSLPMHPINLSYHWMDEQGNVAVFEGVRTPMPTGELSAGAIIAATLTVRAPDCSGRYRLSAMPVQELVCWFDNFGFSPLEIDLTVSMTDQKRDISLRDVCPGG